MLWWAGRPSDRAAARRHPRLDRLDRPPGARRRRGAPDGRGRRARRALAAPSCSSSRRARSACATVALSDRTAASAWPRAASAGRRRRGRRRGRRGARHAAPMPTSSSTRSSAPPVCAPRSPRSSAGKTLALANKESLVVGGELVTSRVAPGQLLPVDWSTRRSSSASSARTHATSTRIWLTASRRALPRTHARRARVGHARAGARAPDVDDGAEDHHRLGDSHEQGARGHRGAPPLRRGLRPDPHRRAPAVAACTRWSSSPTAP